MNVALICVGLLGLLVFGLGLAVSLSRGRSDAAIGHPDDPSAWLHKIVRAHGNTIEYAPMLAILFLVIGSREPGTWILWVMGLATLSRYLIAIGLIVSPTLARPHPLRFTGALGTYVFGLVLAGDLLRGLLL